MFFILTMLVLAQFWNLLAGYGGLVSIGQQAFVGIGAYAMFGVVILMGWIRSLDPAGRRGGPDARHPDRLLRLPPAGRLFRHRHLGDRRGGAAVSRSGRRSAAARARRCRGRPPARCGRPEVDRNPLRRAQRRRARHPRLLAGAGLAVATIGGIYWLLRTKRGLAWRRCATTSKRRNPSASMQAA
jgi:branched-chain amino acid transport system permease protein